MAGGFIYMNNKYVPIFTISNAISPTSGISQLINSYREAAVRHGDAIARGDHQSANRAANRIAAIYSELRRRGLEAQRQLIPLLDAPEPRVRGWAAAHSLEFAPSEGEAVLIRLVSQSGLLGLSAEMTLKEWRAGRLRFP